MPIHRVTVSSFASVIRKPCDPAFSEQQTHVERAALESGWCHCHVAAAGAGAQLLNTVRPTAIRAASPKALWHCKLLPCLAVLSRVEAQCLCTWPRQCSLP